MCVPSSLSDREQKFLVDMAHDVIFREELAKEHPIFGRALWEPDPGGQYNAVEVGDVGFIRSGRFHRLFNVLHPKDHPSHQHKPHYVPDDHQQLQHIAGDIFKGEIRTDSRQHSNYFCSKNVTLESHGLVPSASRYSGFTLHPLESGSLTPNVDLKTNHSSHFHVTADKALYWPFLYQPKVRTPSLLAHLVIGWSNILTPGMPFLGVLAWGSNEWRI